MKLVVFFFFWVEEIIFVLDAFRCRCNTIGDISNSLQYGHYLMCCAFVGALLKSDTSLFFPNSALAVEIVNAFCRKGR